jgi:hypothetical protein
MPLCARRYCSRAWTRGSSGRRSQPSVSGSSVLEGVSRRQPKWVPAYDAFGLIWL